MMAVSQARPTVAFIYGDEQLVRRNRLREKIQARGFTIKKEYASSSKVFDFSTVDLVIAVREGTARCATAITNEAARAEKDLIFVDHAASRAGWDRLDAYAAPALQSPVSFAPVAAASSELDPDTAQLFDILEKERDEARVQVQKLSGELGNVRADRDRLTKERDEARGLAARLETQLVEATLDSGELQDQRAAWQTRLDQITKERDAAIAANERLRQQLTARAEHAERTEDLKERIHTLESDLEKARKRQERIADESAEAEVTAFLHGVGVFRGSQHDLRDAIKIGTQRVHAGLNALRARRAIECGSDARGPYIRCIAHEDCRARPLTQPAAPRSVREVQLEKELAKTANSLLAAQQALTALKKSPPPPPPPSEPAPASVKLKEIATALSALVNNRMMTEREAFERLMEAAK